MPAAGFAHPPPNAGLLPFMAPGFGPALFFAQESAGLEPKPAHSYIGLIAMAILSSAEKKLILSDIYQVQKKS